MCRGNCKCKKITPENSYAIPIIDDNDKDVLAIIVVGASVDVKEIKKEIIVLKHNNSGKWSVSTILEGLSCDFVELEVESIYI